MPTRAMYLVLFLVGLIAQSGCGDGSAPSGDGGEPLQPVTLMLNWFPEAEHGGFYTALINGYYRDEGIEMTIQSGGVDVPVIQRVATGQVQFGVANADPVIFGRNEGARVVGLMAPMQVSPRCILVHEESGFESLADLRDVTLAISPRLAFSTYMRANFPLTDVQIVPYSGSVASFVRDPDYAQQGYNISEPFVARQQGANPRVLMLADEGWNPYTSILITRDRFLEENADIARAVVRASLRGWISYMEDPYTTNEYIHSLNPQMTPDILEFGWREMESMVYTEETGRDRLGLMTTERWDRLIDAMEELGLLRPGAVTAAECFDARFLEEAHAAQGSPTG